MRKTALKVVPPPKKSPHSVDDLLAEHLKLAEHHLIAALKLFYGPVKPARRVGYQKALERAQEAITGLYREELIRIRGPLKPGKKK